MLIRRMFADILRRTDGRTEKICGFKATFRTFAHELALDGYHHNVRDWILITKHFSPNLHFQTTNKKAVG